ncbi:protein tyrosine kinase [Nitzschia inconspicua]|uniref:Protein tyrosine kinase n=1 Tax=Nitzschia inconspicua TaxID=303405 RepID=A0A9K3PBT7_9STRA|nr:protein tyrosine kinase [Nitzschia inconspicua]
MKKVYWNTLLYSAAALLYLRNVKWTLLLSIPNTFLGDNDDIGIQVTVNFTTSTNSKSRHCRVVYLTEDLKVVPRSRRSPLIVTISSKNLDNDSQSMPPYNFSHSHKVPDDDEDGDDDDDDEDDDNEDGKCVPIGNSSKTIRSSCNVVHEAFSAPRQLYFTDWGTVSLVMEVEMDNIDEDSNNMTSIAMKGSLFHLGITEDELEGRKMDAIVQEQLTSSPFVMDIYGLCGTSILAPLATDGSLYDYVFSVRNGGAELSPHQKLKVAIHMAEGLAAVHDSVGQKPHSFVHNDLDVSQFIFFNGIFKFNDFNHGQFLLHRRESRRLCFRPSHMAPAAFRAPEDLQYIFTHNYRRFAPNGTSATSKPFSLAKAEIYTLGMAHYHMLTNRWMWEGQPGRKNSMRRLMAGERPQIPQQYSDDVYTSAIVKVILQCWNHNPNERPTARQVAETLKAHFVQTGMRKNDTADKMLLLDQLRITMPPLVSDGIDDFDDYL